MTFTSEQMVDNLLEEYTLLLQYFQAAYSDYNEYKDLYDLADSTYTKSYMLLAEDAMCDLLETMEHIEFMVEWFGGEVPTLNETNDEFSDDVCKCTQCKCQD